MAHKHGEDDGLPKITTLDLIRRYLISKIGFKKQALIDPSKGIKPDPNFDVNSIAVILDGTVEEVVRAQNRLAALLLSQPTFVEFDPKTQNIVLGKTRYEDDKFIEDLEQKAEEV